MAGRWLPPLLALALVSVTGCNQQTISPDEIEGEGAERGKALFALNPLAGAPGCVTCHAVGDSETIVAPTLSEMRANAGSPPDKLSTENYLRQAIIDPDAYIPDGYNPAAMPNYANFLDDDDIDDLIAYILDEPQ